MVRPFRVFAVPMLDVEFAQLSDPGTLRDHNEDYLGYILPKSSEEVRTRGWLFVLADGVGGQDKGEVASRLAVEKVTSGFRSAAAGEPPLTVLPRIIQAANGQIYESGMAMMRGCTRMATTIVVCALRFDRATVAHAGDSRCYLVRQGRAVAVTRDHTVTSEQMRLGLVSSKEATAAATSHLLTRSLGNEMFLSVETSEHQIFAGDVLVLCSDGLHHSLSNLDIARVAGNGSDLAEAASELVTLAKERDGSDNISVQLIRVRDVERVGMYRGRHYKIH